MNALVGYTGFVGSNIYQSGVFDAAYNSRNIEEAYGTNPDLLIYAGLRAEKYLANQDPRKDMELILQAEENIAKIGSKKMVLISTIDVFKVPKGVDENSEIDTENLHAYGYNRYQLEMWVREEYPDALIVRLPALFGRNIKKNFIYDYINVIPFMLKEDKLLELAEQAPGIKQYYRPTDDGFYQVIPVEGVEKEKLKSMFTELGFSALNFTDSRSKYQFYDLGRLWDDISTALSNDIKLWHPATEPVSAGELYHHLTGKEFVNELSGKPADYDYRTIHGELFGGMNGYIHSKNEVMRQIKDFVYGEVRV